MQDDQHAPVPDSITFCEVIDCEPCPMKTRVLGPGVVGMRGPWPYDYGMPGHDCIPLLPFPKLVEAPVVSVCSFVSRPNDYNLQDITWCALDPLECLRMDKRV